jgi:hypothetical protein
MYAINEETLENLYKSGKYDDLHALMSNDIEESDQITHGMRVWYGRLLETLGDDTAADKQYALAGRTGAIDSIRSLLRQGCSVRQAICKVTENGYPEACGFLARFLETSLAGDDTLHDDIVSLYCMGECVDYACEFAALRGEPLIQQLLAVLAKKGIVPPTRKMKALISYFEKENNIEGIIRVLSASSDEVTKAAQMCLSRNLRKNLCGMLSDRNVLNRLKVDLISRNNTKESIESIAESLDDPQLRFNLYLDLGIDFEEALFSLYVANGLLESIFPRLECHPQQIRMEESYLHSLIQQANDREDKRNLGIMASYTETLGIYSLSCKLWTKVGEPNRAMHALIEDGNAEAVASYAISTSDVGARRNAARFLKTRSSLSIYCTAIFEELKHPLSTGA